MALNGHTYVKELYTGLPDSSFKNTRHLISVKMNQGFGLNDKFIKYQNVQLSTGQAATLTLNTLLVYHKLELTSINTCFFPIHCASALDYCYK
jgi:hypothetical protein